jgi:hypothetical protein
MAELMVTVLGGVAAVDGGSRRRCCDFFFFLMQRPLFFFVSPLSSLSLLCLSSSLPFSLSKTLMFLSFGLSFLPQKRSDSLSRSPFLFSVVLFFFPPFLFCIRVVFIEAGGAGSTLPHPIAAYAWGARRLLCHDADSGGQWRRRLRDTAALASHHEMGGV